MQQTNWLKKGLSMTLMTAMMFGSFWLVAQQSGAFY